MEKSRYIFWCFSKFNDFDLFAYLFRMDSLLEGGLCEGKFIELAGSSSSGKTQVQSFALSIFASYKYLLVLMCLKNVWFASIFNPQVCLAAAAHIAHKYMCTVMFLDTCCSFSSKRIACHVNSLLELLTNEVLWLFICFLVFLLVFICFSFLTFYSNNVSVFNLYNIFLQKCHSFSSLL